MFGSKINGPADRLPQRRILESLSFSQKWFRFQGGGPLCVAGQPACPHPPTCSGLCLEAGTCASPSHRMSGSACYLGLCLPHTPFLLTWDLGEPRLYPSAKPGGRSRILACPLLPVGLLCGAPRSHGGCGPGTSRPRMPGQGPSLSPKVWACLFPQGLGGLWWENLA